MSERVFEENPHRERKTIERSDSFLFEAGKSVERGRALPQIEVGEGAERIFEASCQVGSFYLYAGPEIWGERATAASP
jgi:hypothetical protein